MTQTIGSTKNCSMQPVVTNATNNILHVSPEGRLGRGLIEQLEKKVLLSMEQKSVEAIMDLVSKFSVEEELVSDTYAGTLATTKACLQPPEHPRFAGFEKEAACVQNAPSLVVKEYAKVVLFADSSIIGSDRAVEASKSFVRLVPRSLQ